MLARSSATPSARALSLVIAAAFAASTAACDGTDIAVVGGGVPKASIDASSEVTSTTGGPQPTCLADSDCTALGGGPCTLTLCEPQSKRCVAVPKPENAACDDGQACSAESLCMGGACKATKGIDCDDGNPCTLDTCAAAVGCVHAPKPAGPCDDGNPCTIGDHCQTGACVADKNACTCQSDGDCSQFSTDLCAGALQCSGGVCAVNPAAKVNCDDNNLCTVDTCDAKTGACSHSASPDGVACDDGDVCTFGETCQGLACKAGGVATCPAGPGGCPTTCDKKLGCTGVVSGGGACDDGNSCTAGDTCVLGACVGKPTCGCKLASDCSTTVASCTGQVACVAGVCVVDASKALPCQATDTGACETPICTASGCAKASLPDGAACSDGDACTLIDVCKGGACKGGQAAMCDDGNPCTLDNCVSAGGCQHAPTATGQTCNDGNPCTKDESCAAGLCAAGKATCDDGDVCTADVCDPITGGKCTQIPTADGTKCEDNDNCTVTGACAGGKCIPSQILDCDDANPCTADLCVPNGCSHTPIAGGGAAIACNDANPCTTNDLCNAGVCKGSSGACECEANADCQAKEDGNLCNGTLICVANACQVDPATTVTCSLSTNPCVAIACQPTIGLCVQVPVPVDATATVCTDGNACTLNDKCGAGGVCLPGPATACNDQNVCTNDVCDPAKGCTYLPYDATQAAQCDDGNPCTFGDVCAAGGCSAGKNACECLTDLDCGAKDDGNPCDGKLICKGGACINDGKTVSCPPGASACVASQCDPKSGLCVSFASPDGTGCGTSGTCTTGGTCKQGACQGATVSGCDDGNPCTKDSCEPSGCVHNVAVGSACDDGNTCTKGEACSAGGTCGGGSNVCTCKADSDCVSFDDGNLCNGIFSCQGGQCQPKTGSVVVCDKAKDGPCSTNTCDAKTGQCGMLNQADGTACSDGDACTQSEACALGTCKGGSAINCDDGNACTADGCSPIGGCTHTNTTLACDDGNPCTTTDACKDGKCAGTGTCECKTDADCKNDTDLCNGVVKCSNFVCQTDPKSIVTCTPGTGGACAVNACEPKTGVCGLTPVPDGTQCDDNSICTGKDQCVGGTCKGTATDCDDKNVCTSDACDPKAGCTNTQNAGPCDDGNACSSPDVCNKGGCAPGPNVCGVCKTDVDCKDDGDLCNGTLQCSNGQCISKPGSVVTCPAGDACTGIACAAASGQCVKTSKPDGQGCDDGTACTGSSACFGGACVGSSPLNCDDKNVCTLDSCDAKAGCQHSPVPGACDDGNACTVGDVCSPGGQCISGANQCQCTGDADCAKFEDGDVCNGTLVCAANKCAVKTGSVVVCPDGGACATNVCDGKTGKCNAAPKPNGTPCDDKSLCTSGDACQSGTCTGANLNCADTNPCTQDLCDANQGCTHPATKDGTVCDDGNKCTGADACKAGQCASGANVCQCQATADCGKFEDGNACNGTLVCTNNACVLDSKTVVSCAATGKQCTANQCNPANGKCETSNTVNGTPCGGPELCGGVGQCQAGVCNGPNGCGDDGNPCTTAVCGSTGTCSQTNNTGTCDDGNVCTVGDACSAGACKSGANQCQCKTDADCAALDNGNLCDGVLMCSNNQCVPKPNSVVSCPPSAGACQANQCDPKTGQCAQANKQNGTPCDDTDSCTTSGQCFGGACLVGQVNCNDNNVCTIDSCDPKTGCKHTNTIAQCNDNNPCTPIDVCLNGVCQGPFNNCACQNDSQCQQDNNACNGTLSCQQGTCKVKPGSVIVCDPSKNTACLANTCQTATGACLLLPKQAGTPCNDANTCTGGDVCSFGTCIGVPANCDDAVGCTLDACDAKIGCTHVGQGALCNDNNVCTTDSCDLVAGCLTTPALGGKCDDGSACTSGDVCGVVGGKPACVGGAALTCNDNNPCTTDTCDPKVGCVSTPQNGAACNDNTACTTNDVCTAGACVGTKLPCNDNNPCTTDTCNPQTGCVFTQSGNNCNDNNACTTGDTCVQGQCLGAGKLNCDDANPCTADSCSPQTGCLNTAGTGPCNDNNPCTSNDTCGAKGCAGTSKACDDGNTCTTDSCDKATGNCVFAPNSAACSDGNNCTSEACSGGSCKVTPKNCDDGVACTTDSCNPADGSCTHVTPTGFTKNFDDGLVSPLELNNPHPLMKWSLDSTQSSSPKTSLYFGWINPQNGQHSYNMPIPVPIAITGTAALLNQAIPAGVTSPVFTAKVLFNKAPNEPANCNNDRVEFRINGAPVAMVCTSTNGFATTTIPLDLYKGQTIGFQIVFIANNSNNNGQGAWVDDLAISWKCP